jgi:uncharacterized protein YkwD
MPPVTRPGAARSTMRTRIERTLFAAAALSSAAFLTACGGGGGSSSGGGGIPSTPVPTPTSTATPQGFTVTGSAAQIPVDAYGPVTIGGSTFQSANAASTTPLAGATVIVGPVPVNGATPPTTIPSGDQVATTKADGTFSVTLAIGPAAPVSNDGFVTPSNNAANIQPPATGYYVQVFGAGSDGQTAGKPVPYHGFRAVTAGTVGSIRITTTSTTEAAFLALVNSDRARAGSPAIAFDENAEEVARMHASDEGIAPTYYCHYDRANRGPNTRYAAIGALGLTTENLAGVAYAAAEGQVEAEAPNGGHYLAMINPQAVWVGLADVVGSDTNHYVDQEFVQLTAAFSSGALYSTAGSCPSGTTANGS